MPFMLSRKFTAFMSAMRRSWRARRDAGSSPVSGTTPADTMSVAAAAACRPSSPRLHAEAVVPQPGRARLRRPEQVVRLPVARRDRHTQTDRPNRSAPRGTPPRRRAAPWRSVELPRFRLVEAGGPGEPQVGGGVVGSAARNAMGKATSDKEGGSPRGSSGRRGLDRAGNPGSARSDRGSSVRADGRATPAGDSPRSGGSCEGPARAGACPRTSGQTCS